MTVEEIFWEEMDLVWRTFRYVIKGWVEFPGKIWRISIWELGRLWNMFVGLKAVERNWEWKMPTRDEV